MKLLLLSAVALALAFGGYGMVSAAPPDSDEVPLTLTGCVMAGKDDDSFLLTNIIIDGTTLAPVNAFYRLDDADDLEDHVGQRVEVKGTADLTDMEEGELRVEVEDGRRTVEVDADGDTVEVEQNFWFGTLGSMDLEAEIATYEFDVDEIRRVNGLCPPVAVIR